MIRALILFTSESIEKGQAEPARLKELLESAAPGEVVVDAAVYDDLSYVLTPSTRQITVHSTGRKLDEYDVVYLRRIKESTAQAIAVGKYCQSKQIAVFDEEIANRPGSMGKLTQYMQFSIGGFPFPDTLYSSSHELLLQAFDNEPMAFPVILKSVSGSRGSDNYLVASREELQIRLEAQPEVHFLIQAYVPNKADYRVWICGGEVGPILYRTRSSGHLNNTSQGSNAELLDPSKLPASVLEGCRKAAKFLERDVAGVDVVFENDDTEGKYYFFEVNRAPQIENTPFEDIKAAALVNYMQSKARELRK